MRKLLLSLTCTLFLVGLAVAADTVTVKSFKAETKERVAADGEHQC